jgi:Ca2+-dependent lipid-binding protein
MDSNGFSDPYVKISLAGKEVKSKIIYKNLNPRWSEVFTFTGVLKDLIAEPLSLRCKDKDTFTSGKLGEASVDLGGLARTRTVELQAQLSTQGTVYLRAFWQADGDSSPSADFTADVPAIIAAAAAAARVSAAGRLRRPAAPPWSLHASRARGTRHSRRASLGPPRAARHRSWTSMTSPGAPRYSAPT